VGNEIEVCGRRPSAINGSLAAVDGRDVRRAKARRKGEGQARGVRGHDKNALTGVRRDSVDQRLMPGFFMDESCGHAAPEKPKAVVINPPQQVPKAATRCHAAYPRSCAGPCPRPMAQRRDDGAPRFAAGLWANVASTAQPIEFA
jgi:hypothetical protein